jgi:hypothetical protein
MRAVTRLPTVALNPKTPSNSDHDLQTVLARATGISGPPHRQHRIGSRTTTFTTPPWTAKCISTGPGAYVKKLVLEPERLRAFGGGER